MEEEREVTGMQQMKHEDKNFCCNRTEQKGLRRSLRTKGTAAEAVLWTSLKCCQTEGVRWRRQYGIGSYVLDFYCPKLQLAIELDGEPHFSPEGLERDQHRSEMLEQMKDIRVIRFENCLVFDYLDNVLETIREEIRKRKEELGFPTTLPQR